MLGAVDGQSDGQAVNERLTVWRPEQHVVRRAFGAHLLGHRRRRELQPEPSIRRAHTADRTGQIRRDPVSAVIGGETDDRACERFRPEREGEVALSREFRQRR